LTQGLENNEKSHKNLEINDLNEQIWVKRLDMVFDLSNFKGLKLNEKEISEYVNFLNKLFLKVKVFMKKKLLNLILF